ncbi:MAG: hypothetical protein AAFY98_09605 [Verrucomicrobiota bacterium]
MKAACLQADETSSWLLFFQFHQNADKELCAVTWSTGDEDSFASHSILISVPNWIKNHSGRQFTHKHKFEKIHYLFLPHSLRGFCQSYEIDMTKLNMGRGQKIIDLGTYSERFTTLTPSQVAGIEKKLNLWQNKENWQMEPLPEARPPAWLNRPLERKFYYLVPE